MIIYGQSDQGLVRKQNQDSFYYQENENHEVFAFVCDGIGGGNAGDVASQLVKDSLQNAFINKPSTKSDADCRQWIEATVLKANDEVFIQSTSSTHLKGMGTTIAGVFIHQLGTYIFHCGDSRVYALYDEFICLTEDHNFASDLIHKVGMDVNEASKHPQANMLTNALGIWDRVVVTIHKVKDDYSKLLICSDGLSSFVPSASIESTIREKISVKEQVMALIEASKMVGGFDNITVIIVAKEGL